MFAIQAFVFEDSPFAKVENLRNELVQLFPSDGFGELTVSDNPHPFSGAPRLIFRWPAWSFTVAIEMGDEVSSDAELIGRQTGVMFADGFNRRRLRFVFGQDDSGDFTNHIAWIVAWLKSDSRVVIYGEEDQSLW